MEFSWSTTGIVLAINLLCIGLMIGAQYCNRSLPPRKSIIPGTKDQPFLYWTDFICQAIGDTLGLPFIQIVFAHFIESFSPMLWIAFAAVALMDAAFFMWLCWGEAHKPDYGFPTAGRISLAGILHLAYHGVNVAIFVATIYFVVIMMPVSSWIVSFVILGMSIYASSFLADFMDGNFAGLKKVEQKQIQSFVP